MLGQICQLCGKRPATSHLTEIDPGDGERRELHMCQTCIEELDLKLEAGPPPIAQILDSKPAAAGPKVASAEPPSATPDITCPTCGLTYSEFTVNNRFGCAHDYTAFGERIEAMLKRYHGSSAHAGRLPSKQAGSTGFRLALLSRLDTALREAVANEAYERAAALRDEIRRLDEHREAP